MDNGWIVHKSFTSRRRRSNNIRNDFKALPRAQEANPHS